MIDLGGGSIVVLQLDDATSLNNLLLNNTERFQRFFPKTLAQNLNIKMSEEYILTKKLLIATNEEYTLGLKEKISGDIIGLVIIKNINREIADAEVAYCLGANFGGKGLMTKAVNEIGRFAKEECHLKTLFILAHKTNRPSIRVAEKTGYDWSETQLKSYTPVNEADALDMEKFVKTL